MNREARLVGLNRILEEHIQHQLVPENGRAIREFRARDVRERLVVRRKRRIGFHREARIDDARLRREPRHSSYTSMKSETHSDADSRSV